MRLRIDPSKDIKTVTVIGDALYIENRTLYPVVRISTLKTKEQNLVGAWASPLAMIVVESTQAYAVPLTDESITFEQLLEEVPSLKYVVKDHAYSPGACEKRSDIHAFGDIEAPIGIHYWEP